MNNSFEACRNCIDKCFLDRETGKIRVAYQARTLDRSGARQKLSITLQASNQFSCPPTEQIKARRETLRVVDPGQAHTFGRSFTPTSEEDLYFIQRGQKLSERKLK